MIEELAVGARFKLPYIHVVVDNAYLGLIRQSQRGFDMDYCVSLAFENINSPEAGGYSVDHVKVAEGLGCKAVRVERQEEIDPALQQAERWMAEYRVPVVIEIILERATNIAMGTEVDNVVEFEELALGKADAPTAVALLDRGVGIEPEPACALPSISLRRKAGGTGAPNLVLAWLCFHGMNRRTPRLNDFRSMSSMKTR